MMFGRGFFGGCNFGNNGYYGGNGYFDNAGYSVMHYGFGLLIMVGIIVLIAVLIYSLTHKNNKKIDNNSTNSVMETLKMKYVRGEITEEEYLRRKDLLNRD